MPRFILFAALSFGTFAATTQARAEDLPKRVGECSNTTIKTIETRLEGMPTSGSAVRFENGGYQVSYDTDPAIQRSKAGDPVKVCLVYIPQHCPKGDKRGRIYRTTNLRTHQSWKLPDAEHGCGGA